MAERQGFEPWVRKRTTVFETAPFDHSGISPLLISQDFSICVLYFLIKRSRSC